MKYHLKEFDVVSIQLLNTNLPNPNGFEKTTTANLGPDKLTQFIQLGYIVDESGYLTYPGISKTLVKGLTISEVKQKLENKLLEYIDHPNLDIRLLNFQVSILGEINRPGKYYFNNPRVTVLDAIAKAGDLTPFADRRTVYIKRESRDSIFQIPITLRNAGHEYLFQNDVVYIPPVKQKAILVQDPFQKVINYLSAALSVVSVWLAINK